ncbi:hypothetical protein GA0115234_104526 [Streptomyces sp. DvalAA-43]|nr:hypothetical protein GA0115234_104526 [Streptomyces sp. DvalAA-43]
MPAGEVEFAQKVDFDKSSSVSLFCLVQIVPVESASMFAVKELINGVPEDGGETFPRGIFSQKIFSYGSHLGIVGGWWR